MANGTSHVAEPKIKWRDPELVRALKELEALPGGREVIADINCEYLVASFLVSAGLKPEDGVE
jgi:hypothetical protein